MPDQAELILQEMEETRSSLADKLETLEQTVADTVSAATDSVASVKETVQETVASVKDSVQETVESVKSTFDIPAHVSRHPWICMGGSVLVGYLGGCLLRRTAESMDGTWGTERPSLGVAPARANGWHDISTQPADDRQPAAATERKEPGWLASLGEAYASEIGALKGLAIGAVLGLVRDNLVQAAPPSLRHPLADVLNTLTSRIGGIAIDGQVSNAALLDALRANYASGPGANAT